MVFILFSETGNDIFSQVELNEIKLKDNYEIFEVPEQNEIPRWRTLKWP